MDPETRKAIDAVRADLRAVEARLRSELRAEFSTLESKLESLRNQIRLIADKLPGP